LLQVYPGSLVVPVALDDNEQLILDGTLAISSGWRLWGGYLAFRPLTKNPVSVPQLTFVTYPNRIGSGFDTITDANVNSTFGYNVQLGSSALQLSFTSVPAVTSINPTHGTTKGGSLITITGTNFLTGTNIQIHFGTFQGTFVRWSGAQIVAQTPSGAGQTEVCITIDGRGCVKTSSPVLFTYDAAVVNTSSPNHGPTLGGTVVTIVGSEFGPDTSLIKVMFGSSTCLNVQLVSGGITCTVPGGVGCTTISVTVSGKAASSSPSFCYDAPVILSTIPKEITTNGGEVVLLHGENFAPNANVSDSSYLNVTIGGQACKSVSVISTTYISCITPKLHSSSELIVVASIGTQVSNNNIAVTAVDYATKETIKQSAIPWWGFVVLAGTSVILFIVGLVVGMVVMRRRTGYAPVN